MSTPPSSRKGSGDTPLSVALFSPGWPVDRFANGIVTYVATIAEGLRDQGHRATIVTSRLRSDGSSDILSFGGGNPPGLIGRVVRKLRSRLGPREIPEEGGMPGLAKCARLAMTKRGAQVFEMEETHGWADEVRRKVPIPVVIRLHGPWFLNGPNRQAVENQEFNRRVQREGEAIRQAHGVTAPSQDVLDRTRSFYGFPLEHAAVIANPAPIIAENDCWRADACDPKTILFIGRFDYHKGGDLIIEAFAILAREDPSVKLRFVGADDNIKDPAGRKWSLPELIRDRMPAEAASRVDWVGQQPTSALGALRRQAAMVVACSRYETFGLTLIEAMAYGCPTVATRAGAFHELVEDGVNGLLCQPNDPADLARALRLLLDDPQLAAKLGRNASEQVRRKYLPALLARSTVDYYRETLARTRELAGR